MSTQYDFSDDLMADILGFLADLTGANAPTIYTDDDPGLLVERTGAGRGAAVSRIALPWACVRLPDVTEEIARMTGEHTTQTYAFEVLYCCGYGDNEVPALVQRQKSRVVYNTLMDNRNSGHWSQTIDWAYVRRRVYDNEYNRSLHNRGVRARVTQFFYEVCFEPLTIPTATNACACAADSYCDRDNPTATHAADNLLLATDGTGRRLVGVVKFTLSGLPAFDTTYKRVGSVQSATLALTLADNSNGDLLVGQLSNDWVESMVNWSNLNQAAATTTSVTAVAGVAGETVSVDLTTIVRNWHQSGQPNYGLLLYAQDSGDSMEFYSREDAGTPALSVITQW